MQNYPLPPAPRPPRRPGLGIALAAMIGLQGLIGAELYFQIREYQHSEAINACQASQAVAVEGDQKAAAVLMQSCYAGNP